MTFSLKLIKTEATYEQPEQSWLFTSKYAAHDYSGIFLFNLIPCIVATVSKFLLIIELLIYA